MEDIERVNDLINNFDFKKWRESYRWPPDYSHANSEKKIRCLENAVKIDVEKTGYVNKETLQEIWNWRLPNKCFDRNRKIFSCNITECVEKLSKEVLTDISNNAETIVCLEQLLKLKGTGIPVASAFLRFLDFNKHSYGIIDIHTARFFNFNELTHFDIRERGGAWIKNNLTNISEYSRYVDCLRNISRLLEKQNKTFSNHEGKACSFLPTDIEMAIFMYKMNE